MATKINLFIAYAPEDEALKEQLEKHLGILKRNQFIDIWHNRRIEADADWSQRISQYLDTSQVILLLISPDFLASDYLYQTELKAALKKHYARQATVIPILLRPCVWQLPELEILNVLPANQEAVTSKAWETTDAAFQQIVEGIKKEVITYLPLRTTQAPSDTPTNKFGSPINLQVAKIAIALAAILLLGYFILPIITNLFSDRNTPTTAQHTENSTASNEQKNKSANKYTLNTSAATPVTFSPGDFQYERVYSVVKGNIEDIGGGSNLITLTIGLDFKGIINKSFSTENFRLVATELKGPKTPANFVSEIVDSKSYLEKDIKFELSNTIRKFSVIIEDKADKKWDFSIE